jgi:FKBP-type peptidyl-prolyl cis-trans isomerase FkpA
MPRLQGLVIALVLVPSLALAQTPATGASGRGSAAGTATRRPSAAQPQTPTRAPARPRPAPATTSTAPTTDEEKTLYAIGLAVQRSLRQFDLSAPELALVLRGVSDGGAGKPAVDVDEYGPRIQGLANARASRVADREKATSAAYLAKAAAAAGAVRTETGIVYTELTAGSGASPLASDTVRVHYRGTLITGTEFDSSYARNEPAEFPLGGVIKCWTEGLQRMKVGGKARLVCPSDVAYGDRGNQTIPGGAALIFEVELLGIVQAGPPVN